MTCPIPRAGFCNAVSCLCRRGQKISREINLPYPTPPLLPTDPHPASSTNLLEEGAVLECGTFGGERTNEEVLSGVGEDPALVLFVPGEVVLGGNTGSLVFLSAVCMFSLAIEIDISGDLDDAPHAPFSLSILLFGVLLI